MNDGERHDYGPAGCLDGCAQNGGCGCFLVLIGALLAFFGLRRSKNP